LSVNNFIDKDVEFKYFSSYALNSARSSDMKPIHPIQDRVPQDAALERARDGE